MAPWVYDPHHGGKAVPPAVQERTRQRIEAYANQHYAGTFNRIDVRFRGHFCYIDAYVEPDLPKDWPPRGSGITETREQALERMRNHPVHLVRLRYNGDEERWTVAFYTYSHEKYEPTFFESGGDHGTPEEGFEVGAVYLGKDVP